MFDLTGHVALVTGAGQGMGSGVARVLAGQGAAVVVNDLDESKAEKVAGEIVESGGRAVAAAFDVTDLAAVQVGVGRATETLGGHVDILVNNAGVAVGMSVGPFRTLEPEAWRPAIELNLFGSMNCIKAVLDPMCDAGWGRIVQISSGAARQGLNIGVSMYGAGKSGIEGFIRHLAVELGATGVTANSLALGLMNNAGGHGQTEEIARGIPAGRLGTPEDVGAAVVYLASPEGSWVTGQTYDLNGGSL